MSLGHLINNTQTIRADANHVRSVLIALIVTLGIQASFIYKYGEPYPALILPGFSGNCGFVNGKSTIETYRAVFVSGQETFAFTPRVLLEEFPDSHHGPLSQSFKPRIITQVIHNNSVASQLRTTLFPGYAAATLSTNNHAHKNTLTDWLHKRGQKLLPGKNVSRIEIQWYHRTFALDGKQSEVIHSPFETVVFQLLPAADTP